MTAASSDAVLVRAARLAGVDLNGREIIREGSHAIYRVAGNIVARIGSPGSFLDAEREVRISRWLNSSGIPTVEAVAELPQPVSVEGRPVTWWHLIPDHRPATPTELGVMLRALHAVTPPLEPKLPEYDPFGNLRERLAGSPANDDDTAWLLTWYDKLSRKYRELPDPSAPTVLHGDAWQGNLVVPPSGIPTVLDLDKVSLGRPEWDLIPLAVDYTDFSRITKSDYQSFVDAYGGYDVTTWPGFRTLADIQELRWTAFALGQAATSAEALRQAEHRISCLRGDVQRPWQWDAF
ncbi:phosphotransferase family protein [Nocardia mexicana]|uniref:Phosphotransferase family enzyme n=1 Tax=Nocardia mexicana TaxID=279262 RepID=A0A370H4D5_9NOCA|nr:aminoglycoside phosphotransferase family protein [Nocardia mexicana]RDI51056.1 phosphotransferase family enzyme [Nocardia mexicana]